MGSALHTACTDRRWHRKPRLSPVPAVFSTWDHTTPHISAADHSTSIPSHSAHCSFEETHPRETDTQSLVCKLCPSSSPRARCPRPLGLQCAVRSSVTHCAPAQHSSPLCRVTPGDVHLCPPIFHTHLEHKPLPGTGSAKPLMRLCHHSPAWYDTLLCNPVCLTGAEAKAQPLPWKSQHCAARLLHCFVL